MQYSQARSRIHPPIPVFCFKPTTLLNVQTVFVSQSQKHFRKKSQSHAAGIHPGATTTHRPRHPKRRRDEHPLGQTGWDGSGYRSTHRGSNHGSEGTRLHYLPNLKGSWRHQRQTTTNQNKNQATTQGPKHNETTSIDHDPQGDTGVVWIGIALGYLPDPPENPRDSLETPRVAPG